MKNVIILIILFFSVSLFSQNNFDISKKNPFGKYNPKAPKEVQDYKGLIGECNCKSESKNVDGSWAKPVNMIWRWKYIMNGTAVQDETIKEDGNHSGSIRQYDSIKKQWNVHYYSSKIVSAKLRTWNGNKTEGGKIILYLNQKAPNGTEGFSRLTFYDISDKGYKWIGEWVNKTETVVFPFWKITCSK